MSGNTISINVTHEQQGVIDAAQMAFPNADLFIGLAGPDIDDTGDDSGEPQGDVQILVLHAHSTDPNYQFIIKPDGFTDRLLIGGTDS